MLRFLSMIVDDLHIFRTILDPAEADSPLIIYANTPLSRPVVSQLFQPVPWRQTKRFNPCRGIKHIEFPRRDFFNVAPRRSTQADVEENLSFLALEGTDHLSSPRSSPKVFDFSSVPTSKKARQER
jgi:hypothetical protein